MRWHGQRQGSGQLAAAAEHRGRDAGDLAMPVAHQRFVAIGPYTRIVAALLLHPVAQLRIESDQHAPASAFVQGQQIAGTRMVARLKSDTTDTTDRLIDVCMYGFGP